MHSRQVVATPQDALRTKTIDEQSMVTSPGRGPLIEENNGIDAGGKMLKKKNITWRRLLLRRGIIIFCLFDCYVRYKQSGMFVVNKGLSCKSPEFKWVES